MGMHRILALCAVVVVVGASEDSQGRRVPRLSVEEREEVMRRLERANREEPLCIPPDSPNPGKPMPPLPASLTTDIEFTHQEDDQHKVLYGMESFDRFLNMGVLRYELSEGIIFSRPYSKEDIIHFSITTNESLIITTDTSCEEEGQGNCDPKKNCKAGTMKAVQTEMKDLFGLGEAIGESGYFGVSGILRWASMMKYTYQGRKGCRGMECDLYELCIKSSEDDPPALVSYYWSLTNWTVDGNEGQVPLAIEVMSQGKLEPYFTRLVKQRFDFYEFYSNIRPDIDRLEPPADVYCKNRRVSTLEPPKSPRFFSYSSEAVAPITFSVPIGDGQTGDVEFTVAFTHEGYYDWVSKIVMLDYVPWYIFGQEYRYEFETTQIQDFNQGLTYFLYRHLERCHIRPIENITSEGDVVVNNNGTVSLLPPWMFENLDHPWQFNGIHAMRGVDADVWVGQKNLLGPLFHKNYVSYYASPFVLDEPIFRGGAVNEAQGIVGSQAAAEQQDGAKEPSFISSDKVPLRLEQYLNYRAGKPHLLNNIFDYQTQPPYTQSIDISLCYPDTAQKRHFLLELPPDSLKQVRNLQDNLLHAAQMALSEVAVISPLRINKALLDVKDGKTFVLFTILPLPNITGDAIGAQTENDLNEAADLITSAVDSSKLMVVVHLEGLIPSVEPVYVPLQARSIQEVNRYEENKYRFTTNKGYSPGSMAGLGLGMLLLSVIVAVAIFMGLQYKSGGQGGLPRVTMAHNSPLSPSNTINISSDMTASDI